jgi:hypothetical protein
MPLPQKKKSTSLEGIGMNPRVVVVWALAAFGMFFIVTAWSQEGMQVVSSEAFIKAQRPEAVFSHDAHNEKARIENCSQCHHVYEDGKLVEDQSSEDRRCSDCHGLEDAGRQPGLMKAFHLNCKGCHQEQNKGPVMCGECHVRR